MDKIEVGEYVINKNRMILGQVIEIKSNTELIIKTLLQKDFRFEIPIAINNIRKHSKNKTDLVEVGDYVNGDEVVDKYLFNGEKPVLETTGDYTNAKCLCNSDIKSIVTKEQFESVKYNFEEE